MNNEQRIGWVNGSWELSKKLTIPLNDRAVNFGDGIFETILILDGNPQLLIDHLNRLERSACLLKMANPPKRNWISNLINEGIEKAKLNKGAGAVRLNWSRGISFNRGINVTKDDKYSQNHNFWLEINPIELSFENISTMISKEEQRNSKSTINSVKTLNYLQSIQAKQEAQEHGFNDALLMSTTGEISCGTTANIIVKREGQLLTPRLRSGCLPGIMRAQGLKTGILKEAKISHRPEIGDQWLLINSLSCHSISKINNTNINNFEHCEKLWKSLLVIKNS